MLRWTCRLRDEFEARGFLSSSADSLVLSRIKEAEFVDVEEGAFPPEFRWKTFSSCFKNIIGYYRTLVTLVYPGADAADRQDLVLAMNTRLRTSRSIRALNGETVDDLGQGNIHILWLSETVFISAAQFRIANQIHDYEVKVGYICCFITQLSAFDQVAFEEPSPLPIRFFQHLAPSVPNWEGLTLARNHFHPKRLPASYIALLVGAFPSEKKIVVGGAINCDELRFVLSYPFLPLDTLSFTEDPFDDSVSLHVLMELLKTARYLHRIKLPAVLLDESEEPLDVHFNGDLGDVWMDCDVESPALSMTYEYAGCPKPSTFNAISKIHQAGDKTRLYLDINYLLEGEGLENVKSIVHPFLDGRLTLENLRIRFSEGCDGARPDPDEVRDVMQELASAMIACKSKRLCHFNASFGAFVCAQDDDDDDDDFEFVVWNINGIGQWDNTIFPQLALNWCNKQMTKAMDGRLLPSAIGAINRGTLYRKTTDHIPHDMSTANASVIFDQIKIEAVKSERD
jgi:hypothetical protein